MRIILIAIIVAMTAQWYVEHMEVRSLVGCHTDTECKCMGECN